MADAAPVDAAPVDAAPAGSAPLVRRTTVADWQALRAVRLRALAQDPDAFGSTYERALALPDEEYHRRAAAGATHLALFDGDPVGIVTLVPGDDPPRAELTSMWVDPRHRGTGLAQRLVEAACALGRVDGVREVELWVTVGNDRARRLYERCGFTLTGAQQPVRPDEPDRLEERLRRPLAAAPGDEHALTRPGGVSGAEMLAELAALLTEDGQEPLHLDGAFVLHRYVGETYEPPLLLHVGADDLAGLVGGEIDASDPWPDATRERAALNLLLVHLDETVATRHDQARRHVVLGPCGLVCVTDPAVPDEPPALSPRIEAPEGADLVWTAHGPSGEVLPPPPADGGPRESAGTGQQLFFLRAWLGAEKAYQEGHLLDETLQHLQDQVSAVLGPHALSRFGDQVRRLAPGGDLDAVLADPARCQRLLRALLADG